MRRSRFSFGRFLLILIVLLMVTAAFRAAKNGEFKKDPDQPPTQHLYEDIYRDLSAFKTSARFVDIYAYYRGEDICELYQDMLREHPELFWLSGGAMLHGRSFGGATVYILDVRTLCSIDDVPEMSAELDAAVDTIVALTASAAKTDYEKALFVHDYLVSSCEYDVDTANAPSQYSPEYDHMSFTAYGCLVNRKAAPHGYANAYMLIMNRLGIDCGIIFGTVQSEHGIGDQAWNYIRLDDGYYMVDVAWDDPTEYEGLVVIHDYFCVSTEAMLIDHTINPTERVPYCNGTAYRLR